MKRTAIKTNLNSLHLSDIYSLMLFILYKVEAVPEYATLSRLCFLLDGNNLTRLLAHYAGQTITIPTEEEFKTLTSALLLYQYINLDGKSLMQARSLLTDLDEKQKDEVQDLYLKIIPIVSEYSVDRGQIRGRR